MKIKFYLLLAVASLTLFSCKDAYNIDPADEITDANAITNVADLERALTGVYASIGGQSFVEWSSWFTDECRKAATNRGQGVQTHTWSINSGTNEPSGYYSGIYTVINRANTLLSRVDGIVANTPAETTAKARIKAELKAIRAMAHFDLMRFFATSYTDRTALAVPIVDKVIVFEKLPRNTVGEVTDFVQSELATAYTELVAAGATNSVRNRITPIAVRAIQARFSLYIKDYDNAITYAQAVANVVSLATTQTALKAVYADTDDVNEIVFELKRVTGNGQIGRVYTDANGDVFYNISNDLFSLFASNDLRLTQGILTQTTPTTDRRVGKYTSNTTDFGLADVKLFRVAEMHLILAEAHALKATPDLAAAATAYNALRATRFTGYTNVTFASAADATTKVLEERRRELAFEGHRFFDLKRFGLGVSRIASDVTLNTFAQTLPAGDYRFTLPIPQSAIFANDKLVQNPQY